MCKRDGIFFSVMILWCLGALVELFIFPAFAIKYGTLANLVPIGILLFTIVPRIFSRRYNDWLESDLWRRKH